MSGRRAAALFLIGCALFAAASQLLTRPGAGRCALDGVLRIEPVYAVGVTSRDGTMRTFCSIVCATIWLSQHDRPESIVVRDEMTGRELSAEKALFVKSSVISVTPVHNDVHAFAEWSDALHHIESYEGKWVENPFRAWLTPEATRSR